MGCGRLTEFSGNSNQRKLDPDFTLEGYIKNTYEMLEGNDPTLHYNYM